MIRCWLRMVHRSGQFSPWMVLWHTKLAFWCSENMNLCEARLSHSQKITIGISISSKGIIGLFFMRKTIASERYVGKICRHTTSVGGSTRHFVVHARWDSTKQYTPAVFVFLQEYFGNRVIALNYSIFAGTGMDWPPYSLDFPLRLRFVEHIEGYCFPE